MDGIIVLSALLSYAPLGTDNLGATRGLRTLRVLKPLRTLRRFPSLKSTVATLLQSLPATTGVVVMIAFNWLILGILGVQMLGGKLRTCSDATITDAALCVSQNLTLRPADFNFDDLGVSRRNLSQRPRARLRRDETCGVCTLCRGVTLTGAARPFCARAGGHADTFIAILAQSLGSQHVGGD
jgi:hypothetical protein|eukprot:73775-Prymnesium_polylepis.2